MTQMETLAPRQASPPAGSPTPTPASASTCIGRSAWPNARIAISTRMCAPRRSTKSASFPRCAPNSPIARRSTPGRDGALDLLRRRHALADASADGAERHRRGRRELERRARRGDHAGGQSDQRRGRALPRLSRRRGQPPVDRRAGARRRRPEGARPAPRRRRSGRGGQNRRVDLPALFLRLDLCAARPEREGLARRIGARR